MRKPPPRRPLPRLSDDLIPEILLRLPPDDPACLARASLVCKPWRSVLADPGFLRRYRAFHRTPPILGFLDNTFGNDGRHTCTAQFVPTSSFRPAAPDRRGMYAMAAHHGRVLLSTKRPHKGFIVWDPVRDEQWAVPPIPAMATPRALLSARYEATVFCIAAGCDHLDCHGGPFAVAFVGSFGGLGRAIGCVYSSEAGEWSEPVYPLPTSRLAGNVFPWGMYSDCSVLVGNVFYLTCKPGPCRFIVAYDMIRGKLSALDVPRLRKNGAAVTDDGMLTVTEDTMLGFARVSSSELFLWSWDARPSGAMAWKLHRNIQLNMIRTSREPQHKVKYGYGSFQLRPYVIGFADAAGVVFVRNEAGTVFSVELKSGCAWKTALPRFLGHKPALLLPYLSFYTPGPATSMKPLHTKEVAISDGEFLGDNKKQLDLGGDVPVQHSGDANKERLTGESVDEQPQLWDAIDEQQKLNNQQRRQKQENKKRKLDLKERRKKSAKIHERKMIRVEGEVSCSARKISQRVTKSSLGRLPLVRSLGVNMLRSPLGVLARVAASKRGRYPSATN